MGVDVIGATITASTVRYGASSNAGFGVTYSTFHDSAAAVNITPTALNTNWLIEIDADIDCGAGAAFLAGVYLKAKVDGGYVDTTGARYGGSTAFERELTLRGRAVVTLATLATHTIVAAVYNASSDSRASLTVNTIAITATQLTG